MYRIAVNVKKPKSDVDSLLIMYVTSNKQRFLISTKEKIHPSLWDNKSKKIIRSKRKIQKFIDRDQNYLSRISGIQFRLDALMGEVDKYFTKISMIGSAPDLSILKEHLTRYLNPAKSTVIFNDIVTDFLDVFISESKQGYRKKSNGKVYRKASIVCYENLKQVLVRLEKGQLKTKLTWNHINKDFYYAFLKWHEDHKYSVNYIGRHVKDLKCLMRIAHEEKLHNNDAFRMKYFSALNEVIKKTPLSLEEIQRMIALDLSHNRFLDFSRNIFVSGTCVGLRVSDMKQISSKTIIVDSEGKYIRLKTIKTGAVVNIPINSIAMDILEKYEFQLPEFREQVVNRHLKELARMIGLPEDRSSKLSIHYSRASFAKLAYEQGVPSLYIMRVTGHTSEQNFLCYINIAPEEAVSEFRKHEFFR